MLKQVKVVLLAVLLLLAFCFPVVAEDVVEDVSVNCTIDYAANRVTLSGTVQTGGDLVSCYVEDPTSQPVFIGDIPVVGGAYSVSFTVNEIVTGNYKITLKAQGMAAPITQLVWVEKTATQYNFSCTAGQPLLLATVVKNIGNVHTKTFTVTYDPAILEVDDLDAFTYQKDRLSSVPSGGSGLPGSQITIQRIGVGVVEFTYNRQYPNQTFSGALNLLKFKAKQTGTAQLSIEMN